MTGFDARLNEKENARYPIPFDVRRQMFLRPEIEHPLSIDPLIWPSVFDYSPGVSRQLGAFDSALISHFDNHQNFWSSLEDMERKLAEFSRKSFLLRIETLPSLPHGSRRLGYDVADTDFQSALLNNEHSVEEWAALRIKWSGKINRFGLLITEQDALIFNEMCPSCSVYALYEAS